MTGISNDRRKRERITLQCIVESLRESEPARPLRGTTVNLSSDGFYWVSTEPFTPGEHIRCAILVQEAGIRLFGSTMRLECRVEVMRVEMTEKGFGLGCRIEDFTFSNHREPSLYPAS